MHPAFSVIFLTTLIGVGQGLFLALYTGQVYAVFHVLSAQGDSQFYALGSAVSLLFLIGGLIASFFHLGHPERAWRAASKWRTSWLSREVVVLPAFMGCVFLYGAAHWLGWDAPLFTLGEALPVNFIMLIGALATLLCFALFISTGMIYACLRFLQEWHTPLTVVNFILLGGASGFSLATAYAAFAAPALVEFYGKWAIVITLIAFFSRFATLLRNCRLKPKSTLQTAIGVRHSQIAQKTQGSMGGSFNTREYFHGKTRAALRSVKWLMIFGVFVLPVPLLAFGLPAASAGILLFAFTVQYAGLVAERWFFFAQANHPQNLYYQTVA